MELNKIIENSKDFPNKLNKAFQKDLNNIINILIENFDIYQRDSKVRIEKEYLHKFLTKDFKTENVCSAVTKNGLNCSKKSHGDSKYCKIHYNKHMYENLQKNKMNEYTEVKDTVPILLFQSEKNNEIREDLEKKFIEDSFYLVDDKFIYDNTTYEKVGYIRIDNVTENKEYILTDDPFILGVYN